jgi:hypothetical protein
MVVVVTGGTVIIAEPDKSQDVLNTSPLSSHSNELVVVEDVVGIGIHVQQNVVVDVVVAGSVFTAIASRSSQHPFNPE